MGNLPLISSSAKIYNSTLPVYSNVENDNNNKIENYISSLIESNKWDDLEKIIKDNVSIESIRQKYFKVAIFNGLKNKCPLYILKLIFQQSDQELLSNAQIIEGFFLIHLAIIYNPDIRLITFLIEHDIDCCARADKDGNLPIHLALSHREIQEDVLLLIINSFPIAATRKTKLGKLPIHTACEINSPYSVIKKLIEINAKGLEEFYSGRLPLHFACEKKMKFQSLKLVLDSCRDTVSSRGSDGMLPLHFAVFSNFITINQNDINKVNNNKICVDTIKLLIEYFPAGLEHRDRNYKMPLHYALDKQCNSLNKTQLEELIVILVDSCYESAAHRDKTASPGNFPLHIAIHKHLSYPVINSLLKAFPQAASEFDVYGMLPLRSALETKNKASNETIVAIIDAYPPAAEELDASGRSALHYAASRNFPMTVVTKLVEAYPMAASVQDNNCQVPLHIAVIRQSSLMLLQLLIDTNPSGLCTRDKYGFVPLNYAIENGIPFEYFKTLLSNNYSTEVQSSATNIIDNKFPLHHSIEFKNETDVIVLLMNTYLPVVKEKDSKGRIPLTWAIQRELPLPSLLAIEQAYHDGGGYVTDNDGLLPIHYAIRYNTFYQIIEQILLSNKSITLEINNPIHVTTFKSSALFKSELFENHPYLLLHYAIDNNISAAGIAEILIYTMPYSHIDGAYNSLHYYTWSYIIAYCSDKYWEAIELVLTKYESDLSVVRKLYEMTDNFNKKVMDIATEKCLHAIIRRLYFFSRYEFDSDISFLHKTQDSLIKTAIDNENKRELVVLKFIKTKRIFHKEVLFYEKNLLKESFTIPIRKYYDADENEKFRKEIILKGFSEYPYCIVYVAGNQDLRDIMWRGRIAGVDFDIIKNICKNLFTTISIMHKIGIIHLNIKPSHFVRNKSGMLKIIDFSCSSLTSPLELTSTGSAQAYLAPELIRQYKRRVPLDSNDLNISYPFDSNEFISAEKYLIADISQDMWSVGIIMYYLLTGEHIFLTDVYDNLDINQIDMLEEWPDNVKEKRLKKVKDFYARNLLDQLLSKNPKRRPDSNYCLAHPYFNNIEGNTFCRFPGMIATNDFFVVFRESTDESISELARIENEHFSIINNLLVSNNFSVLSSSLDKVLVENSMTSSAAGIIILSKYSVQYDEKLLHDNESFDLFLYQLLLILELKARGLFEKGIFIVIIGNRGESFIDQKDNNGNSYLYEPYFKNYFGEMVTKFSEIHPFLSSNIIIRSILNKVKEYLKNSGFGHPYFENFAIKDIWSILLSLPSFHVIGETNYAFPEVINNISSIYNGETAINIPTTKNIDGYERPLTAAFNQMYLSRIQSPALKPSTRGRSNMNTPQIGIRATSSPLIASPKLTSILNSNLFEYDFTNSNNADTFTANNSNNEEINFFDEEHRIPYFTEIVGEDKANTSAAFCYLSEKLEVRENRILNLESEVELLRSQLKDKNEKLNEAKSKMKMIL